MSMLQRRVCFIFVCLVSFYPYLTTLLDAPKMLPSPRSSEEHHSQPEETGEKREGFIEKLFGGGKRDDTSEASGSGGAEDTEKREGIQGTATSTGTVTGIVPPTESSSLTGGNDKNHETATGTETGKSKTVTSTTTFAK